MTLSPFFQWIQNQPIPQLVKMDHGTFMQLLQGLARTQDVTELEHEIAEAKLSYVQALRNQKRTERKFPHQREMVKEQVDHLLKDYVRTQELLNLHLQAELNAGNKDNYRSRLEAIFAQSK